MKITFDTQNKEEVAEVLALLAPESNTVKAEEPKTKKTTPSIPKEEKASEEPEKTPTKKPKKEETSTTPISLADLKGSAKNAVTRSSREEVKKTIAEFAEKLAEVGEADYGKLYKKLQELGV